MSGVTIKAEVDSADLKRAMKGLEGVESKAPRMFRNAVNRAATQTMKQLRKGRGGYVVKAKAFNAAVEVKRANAEHMTATIKSRDKPHSLSDGDYYKVSASKKHGLRAKVRKGAFKPLTTSDGRKAFYAGVQTGHDGVTHWDVFQRKGEERLPIKKLAGPGVSKMVKAIFKGDHGEERLDPFIQKTLHEEIAAEIAKVKGARK